MRAGTKIKIESVMQDDVITAPLSSSITDIAKLMEKENIGAVLIIDDAEKLIGIVTDRQIAVKVVARDLDPKTTTVSEIMTAYPMSVSPEITCTEALNIMGDYGYRRLPVEKDEKLVGIVSLGDIAPVAEFDDECIASIIKELSIDSRYK